MVTNLRHKFNRDPRTDTVHKIQRPAITAQPREHIEITADITIQALSSNPELLPRALKVFKKKTKKHEDSCECDKCEHDTEFQELDF